jgi:hypothetical protein
MMQIVQSRLDVTMGSLVAGGMVTCDTVELGKGQLKLSQATFGH